MQITISLTKSDLEAVRSAARDCLINGHRDVIARGNSQRALEDYTLAEIWRRILAAAPPIANNHHPHHD